MTAPRITRADVLHVARLAHLDLSDDEVERFTTDLGAILAYASEIQSVDTTAVAPMSHAAADSAETAEARPFGRPDVAEPCLDRAVALANAPDAAQGLFRVPKVRG